MSIDIKICGLRDARSIASAIKGGANHIGFIFFAKSPRNVSPREAGVLSQMVDTGIKRVAVSVNADDDFLTEIVEKMQPDMLQLHGGESPERVGQIKTLFGLPVMKAFAIRSAEDFLKVDPYMGIADRLLFDAKPPIGSDLPGGNGVSFDWKLFAQWQAQTFNGRDDLSLYPMLSGGINFNNIEAALSSSKARAIDISSGVEKAPGEKDPALIEAFLRKIKQLELREQLS